MNRVRAATDDDTRAVAALHTERIGDGFLVTLGPRFLERLYRRLTRSPLGFVLVGEDAGSISGFVAVTLDTGRFYREFVLRDGLVAAAASAPALLRAPGRAWETLRYGTSGRDDLPTAEVLAIAVSGRAAGRGLGGRLLAGALDGLRACGSPAARVVTAVGNRGALRMYERAGFVRHHVAEVHAGTPQQVLVWRS